MKQILLFLLISTFCYSQQEYNETYDDKKNLIKFENFTIEEKIIVWKMIFEGDSVKVMKNLKSNLKLNFTQTAIGSVKDLSLNCGSISIQLAPNFTLDFKIEFKENKYRVIATNFVFENAMNVNAGLFITSRQYNNIEYFCLKDRTGTFRKQSQMKHDLKCMDELLKNLFTSKETTEEKW